MIVVALLLAQVNPPMVEPVPSGDVVVTAQRLRRLNMTVQTDRKTGVKSCRFKRRSGDPKLDATVCDATLVCVTKLPERIARKDAIVQMRVCLAPTLDPLLRPGEPWRARAG